MTWNPIFNVAQLATQLSIPTSFDSHAVSHHPGPAEFFSPQISYYPTSYLVPEGADEVGNLEGNWHELQENPCRQKDLHKNGRKLHNVQENRFNPSYDQHILQKTSNFVPGSPSNCLELAQKGPDFFMSTQAFADTMGSAEQSSLIGSESLKLTQGHSAWHFDEAFRNLQNFLFEDEISVGHRAPKGPPSPFYSGKLQKSQHAANFCPPLIQRSRRAMTSLAAVIVLNPRWCGRLSGISISEQETNCDFAVQALPASKRDFKDRQCPKYPPVFQERNSNEYSAVEASPSENGQHIHPGTKRKSSLESERKRRRLEVMLLGNPELAVAESTVHESPTSQPLQDSTLVDYYNKPSSFPAQDLVPHASIGDAKIQSKFESNHFTHYESLDIEHIELENYAWIGSMLEHCTANIVNKLLKIYEGFLLQALKVPHIVIGNGEPGFELQGTEVLKILLSEKFKVHYDASASLVCQVVHEKLGEQNLLIRLVALIRQLQCLNSRIIQSLMRERSKIEWTSEHEALHRWFLEDILEPLGTQSNFTFSIPETESPAQSVSYLGEIQAQVGDYLCYNQGDESILKIFQSKRDKRQFFELGRLLSEKTKVTVGIIGLYYKSINLRKWTALFPLDEDYVKFMAFIKYKLFQERSVFTNPEKLQKLKRISIIPWKNEWSLEEVKIFHSTSLLDRVYYHTLESLISIGLPESDGI